MGLPPRLSLELALLCLEVVGSHLRLLLREALRRQLTWRLYPGLSSRLGRRLGVSSPRLSVALGGLLRPDWGPLLGWWRLDR